ncbi:hypothetical protein N9N18_06190 [Euryarchaeota archaeon]|nr:hypothetical protein [Euryarchaeota archaeon]
MRRLLIAMVLSFSIIVAGCLSDPIAKDTENATIHWIEVNYYYTIDENGVDIVFESEPNGTDWCQWVSMTSDGVGFYNNVISNNHSIAMLEYHDYFAVRGHDYSKLSLFSNGSQSIKWHDISGSEYNISLLNNSISVNDVELAVGEEFTTNHQVTWDGKVDGERVEDVVSVEIIIGISYHGELPTNNLGEAWCD